MIATLRGILLQKSLDRIVVEVNGVGYLVYISAQTLADLPAIGENVHLLCHTHVREDALQIFGFKEVEEQHSFELLTTVSGIGPKLAMTTLSGMNARELISAIAAADHPRLQRIPGIGKKTAERIVVELKDKCSRLVKEWGTPATPSLSPSVNDIVEALINLGYKRNNAEKAIAKVFETQGSDLSQEHLLRAALATIREI